MENARMQPAYTNKSSEYVITKSDRHDEWFQQQYYLLYRTRLQMLTDRVLEAAQTTLGPHTKAVKIYELREGRNDLVIGVLMKKSKQRRSVFDEFKEPNFAEEEDAEEGEAGLITEQIFESVCTDEDKLLLENDCQRIELRGASIEKDEFASGFVVGIYGRKEKTDVVIVEKIIYPAMPPVVPWPLVQEESWIMLVSGVCVDSDMAKNVRMSLAFNQLVDWLHGSTSDDQVEIELARRVSRVIFAGDTVQLSSKDIVEARVTKIGQRRNYDLTALDQMDRLFENLVSVVKVDVMSGQNDIVGPMWPQQPMIRHAFGRCRNSKNFNPTTNPYAFDIDGVKFLGTSGQNLHDLLKYTRGRSTMDLMKLMLDTSCVCPTCPDTIEGFPFRGRDPLVLAELPHLFFAGNQADYVCETVELANGADVVCLTLPKFSEKYEAVLLNVRTLKTKSFVFDQAFSDDVAMEF